MGVSQTFAEVALDRAKLAPGSRVLDVATGTGALALAAARDGAQVLATDFSPGMVARVADVALPNVEARVMDGQALDLPDAAFDAVFSIFGVIMFPDWRKGLAEMARVTRPGGVGVVTTWLESGAATFLLLSRIRHKLFPGQAGMTMPAGLHALCEPDDFARELIAAGYRKPRIEPATFDFNLDVSMLGEPDRLFGMSPDWTGLNDADRARVITEVKCMANGQPFLPVPSTALIGIAER